MAKHSRHFEDLLVVQFDHRGERHQLTHQGGLIAIDAKIHVVEAARAGAGIEQSPGQALGFGAGLLQRSKVNPVDGPRKQLLQLRFAKLGKIIGDRAVNHVMRLPGSVEGDGHHARRIVFRLPEVTGGEPHGGQAVENPPAALVLSDRADEAHGMTQFAEMGREIEGRSSQVFGRPHDIPKDFANADHIHQGFLARRPPGASGFYSSGQEAATLTWPVARPPRRQSLGARPGHPPRGSGAAPFLAFWMALALRFL